MGKYKVACAGAILAFGATALVPLGITTNLAFATGSCFEAGGEAYDTFGLARNALGATGGEIKLLCDAETDAYFGASSADLTFDLNGHSYTTTNRGFQVRGEHTFTIKDSVGGGSLTAGDAVVDLYNGAKVVLESGNISATDWGVIVFNDSEFVMNGGKITCTASNGCYGVTGNGTTNPASSTYGSNAKITLNAGEISSTELGVYAPQAGGVTTLGAGLTINAAKAGVEVRAGSLAVNGATINVPQTAEYVFNPNGNGSTASGVAIAVSQHTTKQPISATITSGTFTAPVVLAEANPQHNADEDVAKVAISVTGGTFNATSGDTIVSTEDVRNFVSGGTFNKEFDPSYLANGYDGYEKPQDVWTIDVAVANPEAGIPEKILIQKGEASTLALDATVAKYIESGVANTSVATLNGTTVTGVAAGETILSLNLHLMGKGFSRQVPVYVYDLDDEDADVYVDVEPTAIDSDDIEPEVLEALTESLNGKKVLGYYDIDVKVYAGDSVVGEVDEIKSTEVRIEKPELPELKSGFVRKFYMIRYHDGETTVIDATLDGDYIVFMNDKFSTFALAYEDVAADGSNSTAPNTGAATAGSSDIKVNAAIAAVVVAVVVGMVSAWKLVIKRI